MQYPTRFYRLGSRSAGKDERFFYHPELDVLRLVAFLGVFFHHALSQDPSHYLRHGLSPAATEWLLNAKEAGAYGVDLFFVLSSYLITELLLREHKSRGTFSISAFYVRRALRIWPLYFTFLAVTVLLVPTILSSEQFGPIYIVSFALFIGNWICASYGIPVSVAGPLWSISVEEQFYLGWPLALRLFGINHIKLLAVLMLALALATRVFMAAYDFKHPAVWCSTLARLDPIALGAILAFSLRGGILRISNAFRFLIGTVALVSFLLVARYLGQDGPTSIATYTVTALASTLLLVAVLKKDAPLLRVPPFSWLVYLGRVSYGLYVFHLLALALIANLSATAFLGTSLNFERRFILSLLLTIGLAAISYKWLEQPFLRLKKRFTYRPARGPAQENDMPVGSQAREKIISGPDGTKCVYNAEA